MKLSPVPPVVEVPPDVVTWVLTTPLVTVAGTVTTIWVGETEVTVAATVPNSTVAPVRKPVPVIRARPEKARVVAWAWSETVWAMFIRAVEAFEVPALVGLPGRVHVLTTDIYDTMHLTMPPDLGAASSLSVLLLIVVSVLLYFYGKLTKNAEKYATITGKAFRPPGERTELNQRERDEIATFGRLAWQADDALHHGGVLVEELAELFVDQLDDVALNVAIKLAFGLAFKLRFGNFYRNDCSQSFSEIITTDINLCFFQQA